MPPWCCLFCLSMKGRWQCSISESNVTLITQTQQCLSKVDVATTFASGLGKSLLNLLSQNASMAAIRQSSERALSTSKVTTTALFTITMCSHRRVSRSIALRVNSQRPCPSCTVKCLEQTLCMSSCNALSSLATHSKSTSAVRLWDLCSSTPRMSNTSSRSSSSPN